MELRQLRYFVAVAEELNFTRAAERSGIAQPPLSQQIKALERELGADLFTRTQRHVATTEAGRALLVHARRMLQCAEDAREAVRASGEGFRGAISIGSIYTAAYTIAPRLLRAFRAAYPLVTINLQEMGIAEQQAALNKGVIDVGLLRPPFSEDNLDYITLFDEPFVAAIPSRHRLRNQQSVSLKDLAAEPFVSLPRLYHGSVGAVAAGMFAARRLKPEIVQEVAEMHTLICLVASGLGVSVVPASLAGVKMQDVLYKPIKERTPRTPVCLAVSATSASAVTARFVETVRSIFAPELK